MANHNQKPFLILSNPFFKIKNPDHAGTWYKWVDNNQVNNIWKYITENWKQSESKISEMRVNTGQTPQHLITATCNNIYDLKIMKETFLEFTAFFETGNNNIFFKTNLELLLDEEHPIVQVAKQANSVDIKYHAKNWEWFQNMIDLKKINPAQWNILVKDRQAKKKQKLEKEYRKYFQERVIPEFTNTDKLPTKTTQYPFLSLRNPHVKITPNKEAGIWFKWIENREVDQIWKKIVENWIRQHSFISEIQINTGNIPRYLITANCYDVHDQDILKKTFDEFAAFFEDSKSILFKTNIEILLNENRSIIDMQKIHENNEIAYQKANFKWFNEAIEARKNSPDKWNMLVRQRQEEKNAQLAQKREKYFQEKVLPQITNSNKLPSEAVEFPFLYLNNTEKKESKLNLPYFGQWILLIDQEYVNRFWTSFQKNWTKLFPEIKISKITTRPNNQGKHSLFLHCSDSSDFASIKKIGQTALTQLTNLNDLVYQTEMEKALRINKPLFKINKYTQTITDWEIQDSVENQKWYLEQLKMWRMRAKIQNKSN